MQKLQLSIPEPCHENWQNMTPSDQGRFCNACSKTVVDFTVMSDYEVLNYFSTVSDEKVCGRALPMQLNREMTMPREPKKRRFWYWNYVAMFFMLFSKSNHVKAQGGVEAVTVPVKKPNCDKFTVGTMVAPNKNTARIVSGKITNSDGMPVSNATVKIRGTQTGWSADPNGIYKINVNDGDVLEFSAVGYEAQRQTIRYNTTIADVVLRPSVTGEMVVVIAGGIRRSTDSDEFLEANTQPNQVFEIKVKDKATRQPLNKASITINDNWHNDPETKLTDKNGTYKIKKVKAGDSYRLAINAEGYEKTELTVNGSRTDARKVIKEVYLTKKPAMVMGGMISGLKIDVAKKSDTPTTAVTRIRCASSIASDKPLIVVDDVIMPNDQLNSLDPKNILKIDILKGASAKALYGSDADNGVILITTKQRNQSDTIRVAKAIVKKVANAIGISSNENKINLYPNPVRSGRSFVVALDLQKTGEMELQVTDINGRVVLQKQITTTSKDHLEKIETDERWPAGMYFLNVFNSNGGQQGKLINAVSFVVQ